MMTINLPLRVADNLLGYGQFSCVSSMFQHYQKLCCKCCIDIP
jgi:hypothetical protein